MDDSQDTRDQDSPHVSIFHRGKKNEPHDPSKTLPVKRRFSLAWLWRLPLILLLTPVVTILLLRWIDPPTSAFILQDRLEVWTSNSVATVQHQWVDMEKISPKMQLAVIAAEDQKFPEHFGFDLTAIEDALEHNASGKSTRGASTISQQVAKNLFLWSSRSWLRKGLEAYLTGWIEILWSKQRILEVYLNIAQFDDHIFGVEAASQQLFGKRSANLTSYQSALLAAVLPSPVRYSATNPSHYVSHRAGWIQRQMRQLGDEYLKRL
jgi:monofunctional biosynthetic peptidoglycan transglycosylase